MTDTHKLIVLSSLINIFFSDEVQFDETPEGVEKRTKLRQAILDLSKQEA